MNRLANAFESSEPSTLTGGAMGLRAEEIEEAMSAYFTLDRATFRGNPAWCLQQSSGQGSGPDLLHFAVHHRKVRQAVTYAQQVAGLMRCVVVLEGRHRVVCAAKGVPEMKRSARS
jgi:hypothetical protein